MNLSVLLIILACLRAQNETGGLISIVQNRVQFSIELKSLIHTALLNLIHYTQLRVNDISM